MYKQVQPTPAVSAKLIIPVHLKNYQFSMARIKANALS